MDLLPKRVTVITKAITIKIKIIRISKKVSAEVLVELKVQLNSALMLVNQADAKNQNVLSSTHQILKFIKVGLAVNSNLSRYKLINQRLIRSRNVNTDLVAHF